MSHATPTATGRLVLIGGGARSGKSDFALARGRALGRRRAFLATAQAFDDEMANRIKEHVQARGNDFRTVEEPIEVRRVLTELADAEVDVVVIDCITLWLSNLLLDGRSEAEVLHEVSELASLLRRRRLHAVIVTNEVGMGLVPETPLGRMFRDVSGRTHRVLAGIADEVYLAVLGSRLRLKPAPVTAYTDGDDGDNGAPMVGAAES
jgi:adenosylcobinamide kinase/adenosylcobinamide-phosphate guanylyltransferase